MSLYFQLFLISIVAVQIVSSFDRTVFSNFRATQAHDGYLSFSKAMTFPVSVKWKTADVPCAFNNPLYNFALANETFYCLTNEIWDLSRNPNSSLIAYNLNDGSFKWQTHIYPQLSINTSWDGIVYSPAGAGYIGVLDDNYGDLFILDSASGEVVRNVSIRDGCPTDLPDGEYCIQSGLVSNVGRNDMDVYFTSAYDDGFGTVLSVSPETGVLRRVQIASEPADTAQDPTICDDGNVLIATNLFNNVNAFDLRQNMSHMWSYTVSMQSGELFDNPVMCIPPVSSGDPFQVLFNDIFTGSLETWTLLNGVTGELVRKFAWSISNSGLPAVNAAKQILVRGDSEAMYGYQLTSDGNWTALWTTPGAYYDLMIVDDYVWCSAADSVTVLSIADGAQVWTMNLNAGAGATRLGATVDMNGDPIVLALAVQSFVPPTKSMLFAFQ